MTVAVLVVNWNGGPLLGRCLESLDRQQRRPDHVVVVDNGSSDDSLQLAGPSLRDVQLIRLSANAGFARANNIAAHAARRSPPDHSRDHAAAGIRYPDTRQPDRLYGPALRSIAGSSCESVDLLRERGGASVVLAPALGSVAGPLLLVS